MSSQEEVESSWEQRNFFPLAAFNYEGRRHRKMNKHHVKETREEATDKVKEREKREEEKREEGRRDEGREREQSPNCILVLQDASSSELRFPLSYLFSWVFTVIHRIMRMDSFGEYKDELMSLAKRVSRRRWGRRGWKQWNINYRSYDPPSVSPSLASLPDKLCYDPSCFFFSLPSAWFSCPKKEGKCIKSSSLRQERDERSKPQEQRVIYRPRSFTRKSTLGWRKKERKPETKSRVRTSIHSVNICR